MEKSSSILGKIYIFVLLFFLIVSCNDPPTLHAETTESTIVEAGRSYDTYMNQFLQVARPDTQVTIPAAAFTNHEMDIEMIHDFEGKAGESIQTGESGFIEWKVEVAQEGLYYIALDYFPVSGKSSAIVRRLEIDGSLPFDEVRSVAFARNWTDEKEVFTDSRGHEVRPSQIESPVWMEKFVEDPLGYYNEPFQFYFTKGQHTIRLVSVREPMIIHAIKLSPVKDLQRYEDVAAQYKKEGKQPTEGIMVKIQGEDALYKSDPMLYPIYDRSSPATEPYHHSKIRLNTIGSDKWQMPGQWLAWELEVPEDGLYKIGVKARQALVSGSSSTRKLTIDGKSPFKEVEALSFDYDTSWKMHTLGAEGEPYLFYLEKGKHEIKLEVTLGSMSSVIRKVQESVFQLGAAYRSILMITGTTPDQYRDYEFVKQIPETLKLLEAQSRDLKTISTEIESIAGQKGGHTTIIDRLSIQTKDMAENPETIAERFEAFKGNIGSMGTWIMTARQQPLEIDYIVVASPEASMPDADKGFFAKFVHFFRSFLSSFTEDYDTLGDNTQQNRQVTVWIGSGLTGGRDQAQILKQMVDNYFTPVSGIAVNLELVSMGALLPATIAGKGPDVALQLGSVEPVNFAVRNAVVDLTQFEDFETVAQRFHKSALVPYTFENHVYALPETQTFPIMYYRTDILKELKIDVPQTWEDVIRILPILQKRQMTFGMPAPLDDQTIGAGMGSFATFLFQANGAIYKEGGIRSDLDSDKAIEIFSDWTSLYTNYKLPLQYDFANRFRIGEVPIGIADYSMFNLLSVFAPEIDGLWEFELVPGTKQTDGMINRSVPGGGNGAIMLQQTEDKQAAWEFMKWWTSVEMQVRFGKEMESLLGPAARFPTANLEAVELLPWSTEDYMKLLEQWDWVQGIPEVPGGYYTPRYLDFAFRKVVYDTEDPGDVLTDYVKIINEEINTKRKEFNLDILGEE